MRFKDFLKDSSFGYMFESLDSPFNIGSTVKNSDSVTYYYISDKNLNKDYRIFVERIKNTISIGFERKLNSNWNIYELTNDLSTKEILGLFSTVVYIVKQQKNIDGIMFGSIETKKQRLYINIGQKIAKKMDLKIMYDDSAVFLYKEDMEIFNKNWKYKK